MRTKSRSIVIVQRLIADYRVPFYLGLAQALMQEGITLTVYADHSREEEAFKDGLDALPFGYRVPAVRFGKAYWQPLFGRMLACDLAVVQQENAALLNYALLLSRRILRRPRHIAYWGHGATFQAADTDWMRSSLKKLMTNSVDHWFAYTEASRPYLAAAGVAAESITIVNNSIDMSEIRATVAEVGLERKVNLRAQLGLGSGPIGIFCSRLYTGKRLDFLLQACDMVRQAIPSFELVVIGDGPERATVKQAAALRPWLHFAGPLYGTDKARLLAAGDVLLLPAWVGLSILDGFAAGLPCIAAAFDDHSPEIAYLEPGHNGLFTAPDPSIYAQQLVAVLRDRARLDIMSKMAVLTAEKYSLAEMVRRFAGGVVQAIS